MQDPLQKKAAWEALPAAERVKVKRAERVAAAKRQEEERLALGEAQRKAADVQPTDANGVPLCAVCQAAGTVASVDGGPYLCAEHQRPRVVGLAAPGAVCVACREPALQTVEYPNGGQESLCDECAEGTLEGCPRCNLQHQVPPGATVGGLCLTCEAESLAAGKQRRREEREGKRGRHADASNVELGAAGPDDPALTVEEQIRKEIALEGGSVGGSWLRMVLGVERLRKIPTYLVRVGRDRYALTPDSAAALAKVAPCSDACPPLAPETEKRLDELSAEYLASRASDGCARHRRPFPCEQCAAEAMAKDRDRAGQCRRCGAPGATAKADGTEMLCETCEAEADAGGPRQPEPRKGEAGEDVTRIATEPAPGHEPPAGPAAPCSEPASARPGVEPCPECGRPERGLGTLCYTCGGPYAPPPSSTPATNAGQQPAPPAAPPLGDAATAAEAGRGQAAAERRAGERPGEAADSAAPSTFQQSPAARKGLPEEAPMAPSMGAPSGERGTPAEAGAIPGASAPAPACPGGGPPSSPSVEPAAVCAALAGFPGLLYERPGRCAGCGAYLDIFPGQTGHTVHGRDGYPASCGPVFTPGASAPAPACPGGGPPSTTPAGLASAPTSETVTAPPVAVLEEPPPLAPSGVSPAAEAAVPGVITSGVPGAAEASPRQVAIEIRVTEIPPPPPKVPRPWRLWTDEDRLPYSRIGGGKVAGAMGLGRYATPLQTYAEIRKLVPFVPSEAVEIGQHLEEPVAALWSRRFRALSGPFPITHVRPDRPWATASPDRAVIAAADVRDGWRDWQEGWDGKTTGYLGDDWGDEGTDQMPLDALLQCHAYLFFFDAATWHLSVLAGGQGGMRCRHYRVERAPAMDALIEERCSRFWTDHIVPGVPPAPRPEDADLLAALHPPRSPALVPPPPEAIEVLERWKHARDVAREAKRAQDAATAEVKAILGDRAGFEGWCLWSRSPGKPGIDWEAAIRAGTIPERVLAEVRRRHKRPARRVDRLQARYAGGEEEEEG